MNFNKEFYQERIKFFDGLSKYIFAFLLLIISGLGAIIAAKEKIADSYFRNILTLSFIIMLFSTFLLLFLIQKQYNEINKLR